jgi:SAM-dependent methyltransferase
MGHRARTAVFPAEVEVSAYRALNADLAAFTDRELRAHFARFGAAEGRRANGLRSRTDFAALIPAQADALEIGPFHNPLLHGPTVRYFDVLPKAELVARAEVHGLPVSAIPEIDYVSRDGDLRVVKATFDFVLSSHTIEHQPDLIRHLRDVERLLRAGGRYFVLVPDKRYCFDYFNRESTIADVLAARRERRRTHTLASVVEHRAVTTHSDPARHWRGDHGCYREHYDVRAEAARREYDAAGGAYIDVHAWYFTPESARAVLAKLRQLGHTRFVVERVYATRRDTNEFWMILRLGGRLQAMSNRLASALGAAFTRLDGAGLLTRGRAGTKRFIGRRRSA